MTYIDQKRFRGGHYLGKPAELKDLIVKRRVRVVKDIPSFCDPDLDLLDFGCGNGASSMLLAGYFRTVNGMDIDPDNETAFLRMMEFGKVDTYYFRRIDIETENVKLEQFPRIICFEVVEHLREEKNVKKIADLLKPGGKAVFTVPNKWWIFETHGASLPLLPWNRVPFFSWLPSFIHKRYANARIYTKHKIKNVLTEAGLTVTDTKYITAPLDVLKDGKFKSFMQKFIFRGDTTRIPFLATSIMVTAEKYV
ncbi:MAG: methyltransferase domain-containing protein [Ignavibacteriales bacterium]|nr:methyltransferase domain-containing protein [Ignavibacteriales bacterium]MCF8307101.1 methyltransferase domain-containing protein [Ignavibacteriales bacterium]MCF8316743.1 methyltransferase domain-containing protein [Ignavibacteriales bacterium]MCF8436023.1 methyltransferase domain-containing protein [Ignavibacteriales bacterium]